MNRLLYPLIGLAAVGSIVAVALYSNRGSRMEVSGEINKIRTYGIGERSSVAIVDFRVLNPADYPFMIRTVQVFVDGSGDQAPSVEGAIVADVDARRLFDALPELGPKYNDSLKVRDRLEPKSTNDRMIAARFDLPVADLERRARFRLRLEDIDSRGAASEIAEAKAKP